MASRSATAWQDAIRCRTDGGSAKDEPTVCGAANQPESLDSQAIERQSQDLAEREGKQSHAKSAMKALAQGRNRA